LIALILIHSTSSTHDLAAITTVRKLANLHLGNLYLKENNVSSARACFRNLANLESSAVDDQLIRMYALLKLNELKLGQSITAEAFLALAAEAKTVEAKCLAIIIAQHLQLNAAISLGNEALSKFPPCLQNDFQATIQRYSQLDLAGVMLGKFLMSSSHFYLPLYLQEDFLLTIQRVKVNFSESMKVFNLKACKNQFKRMISRIANPETKQKILWSAILPSDNFLSQVFNTKTLFLSTSIYRGKLGYLLEMLERAIQKNNGVIQLGEDSLPLLSNFVQTHAIFDDGTFQKNYPSIYKALSNQFHFLQNEGVDTAVTSVHVQSAYVQKQEEEKRIAEDLYQESKTHSHLSQRLESIKKANKLHPHHPDYFLRLTEMEDGLKRGRIISYQPMSQLNNVQIEKLRLFLSLDVLHPKLYHLEAYLERLSMTNNSIVGVFIRSAEPKPHRELKEVLTTKAMRAVYLAPLDHHAYSELGRAYFESAFTGPNSELKRRNKLLEEAKRYFLLAIRLAPTSSLGYLRQELDAVHLEFMKQAYSQRDFHAFEPHRSQLLSPIGKALGNFILACAQPYNLDEQFRLINEGISLFAPDSRESVYLKFAG